MDAPDFLLIDGSAVLFRSYHAMPPLVTSGGQPTGAVKGFINIVRMLEKRFAGSQIVVVFDSPGPSFRHELYEFYKSNRKAMPEDLAAQIEPIFSFVKYSGYPLIKLAGYEADDIIATYCRQAGDKQKTALIVSNDKDLAQLVKDRIMMYDSTKNLITDEDGVYKRFGVRPDQIRDFLVLTGDSSDNIPGVPGVGAKTAAKWLDAYGNLESLLEHREEIGGKVGESLKTSIAEIIPLAIKLVNLNFCCPLEHSLEHLKSESPDHSGLEELSGRLEMQLGDATEKASVTDQTHSSKQFDYEVITKREELEDWVAAISDQKVFALDTETDGLNVMRSKLVGLSLALANGRCCYLPIKHLDHSQQLDKKEVLQTLAPILADKDILMIGQNIKFDMHILASNGVEIKCRKGDTMLQSYCLDSTIRHDLSSISKRLLSWQPIEFESIVGKGKNQKTFDQIPVSLAAAYAAEDAWLAMKLYKKQEQQLNQPDQKRVKQIYSHTEVPLVSVLLTMERHGTRIDQSMLTKQSSSLAKHLALLTQDCHALAGMPFNIDSPKQLQTVLFEHLKIPHSKKTSTGQASTAESVLLDLAQDYELPGKVLEYRTLKKLKSTYTDKLAQLVNPQTGRLHSSFNQTVASTGRLSSTNPNLQNIPVRTEQGRQIRKAFIADEGNLLISADYSQIELRIMAHLSQDQGLLKAFAKGEDIHRATAAEIFSTPLDEVSNDQRRNAKAINFGLIYGMSPFGLSRQLGINRQQAATYMEAYFNRYPRVLEYMQSTREQAKAQGYVETVQGRRLYLRSINSDNRIQQQGAERAAINAPMQGTAADIIKTAMIRLHEHWHRVPEVRMIMQIHDELVFEVPAAMAKECQQQITEMMTQASDLLEVPLLVTAGIGDNWLEAH